MTWQQTLGWAAWGALAFFAAAWTFGCYMYIQRGAGLTHVTLNTTIAWWFLLGWTFHYTSVNKLHLFWLAPSVILISLLVTIPRTIAAIDQRKLAPPGLILLLGGYGFILWWLTD